MIPIILFTDLDGTFIDFETYSSSVAAPSAKALIAAGLPVVFCSSKTRSEQKALMQSVEFTCPGIVENGSGLFIPNAFPLLLSPDSSTHVDGDWVQAMGAKKSVIDRAIRAIEKELSLELKPYAEYTARELSQLTGLSESAAHRAKDRQFSETLTAQLKPEQWEAVNERLRRHGLHATCGGRFYTVTTTDCDKGKALTQLVSLYEKQCGQSVAAVAIGDSENDIPMLLAADHAYLVQRPDGQWNPIDIPDLIKVPAPGPYGWVQVAQKYLKFA
jgi:mannosyl-3-phosphoglycerate phosphatase